ncbi:MAG: isochorismatase family protein [Lautropia sp.]|nr:isochorismatase family protein [Lautropia sp.]
MLLKRNRSVLVLVDYQAKLMPFIADGTAVLQEAIFLARMARLLEVPVIGTAQNPLRLGNNDETLQALSDAVQEKRHFDAAADDLPGLIQDVAPDATQVLIAGCEAHVCLLQTAFGLQTAGFEVFVAQDACGSRKSSDKTLAMQRLAQAGIPMVCTESAAFEWLQHCDHPKFREALALIKPH